MSDPRWARLTKIAADSEGGPWVDVSNSLSGKRYRVSSGELAAALLRNTAPENAAVREELTAGGLLTDRESPNEEAATGVDHWTKRSWGLALDYFLWSRRRTFDDGTGTKDERSQAARRLLTLIGPPPSPPVTTEHIRLPKIMLSEILPETENDLRAILMNRRSSFGFAGRNLSLESVAAILWSALATPRGCRHADPAEPLGLLRSFGIAFDFYLCAYQVTGIDQGCYAYDLKEHAIKSLVAGDLRPEMRQIVIGQPSLERASASVILVADFDRYLWRYRHERALRNLYMESGRIVQYLLLAATATKIRTHITPAIRDSLALELLNLPPERHQAFYVLTLG